MILSHLGRAPRIHASAWVAPTATVCGDVTIGPDCRVMHGATVVAEGGAITMGERCIVMQNAALRASARHSLAIGSFCLVGPGAHVVGCVLEDEVFIATGAAVFHGARVERGSEVRVHAVVHLRTRLPAGTTVPIAWVAVGDPAEVLPPQEHDAIWRAQEPLEFPLAVYGVPRAEADMRTITARVAEALAAHREDEVIARGGTDTHGD